ncbi:N-acetylglucosamine-6-phosphate deacetylase [Natranaerovirga pectinivora]|uniref:N-acetylglucosamine-6-phosphate deacetylase n=1 Tax=Natranaerovirga pectinivora TaxID=682400 RepID=A0A4R3MKG9_9FIRM|nr:N-acetylglucosamine-6-phosphate deacetylase [Natranaerovirga pectinivora]TCT14869.1 N-acetylglucosamine-6-phosphate deacetylase [Natranaerovirga pectinivora]
MNKIVFKNARLITPTGITQGEVLVCNKKIKKVVLNGTIIDGADEIIDVKGQYLSPGFIDIHTHGAGNADFMDGNIESIHQACKTHMIHGTTSIVPTSLAGTKESLFNFVELFNSVYLQKEGLPNILGLHIEGPYFAYSQKGAQDHRYLRNPDPKEYMDVLKLTDKIIRWSFAVELEGSMEFLNVLREHGIISSLAHSDATCEEVFRAYENGLSAMTHFYSAMSSVRRIDAYRVAGAVEAGYLLDDLFVEVIADGKHLPKELLQLIYKVKGPDRICLVTDSMRAAGMPEGEYYLGSKENGTKIFVEDNVAKLMDRSAFAGSVATADRLIRTFHELTEAPLYEVVKMMSLTPAKLLKIDRKKGSICESKDADLVVFDEDINIKMVMVRGKVNYTASDF